MEATEEAMDMSHGDIGRHVKGKRTKRQRQSPAPAMGSSSSDERIFSSGATTTSTGDQFEDSTEEEEDMANCLILLAQSGRRDGRCLNSAAPPEAALETRPNGRRGELYECKTCNKCFPSFQALGGHRASHKKPKTAVAAAAEEEKERTVAAEVDGLGLALMQHQVAGGAKAGGKGKVHECSICGSEFTSGQALGGHMRRHRVVVESPEPKKPKSVFTLDLNLPAPDDSDTVEFSKFQTGSDFTREQQPLMFAALVDCHN